VVSDATHVIVNPTAGGARAHKLLPTIIGEVGRVFGSEWLLRVTEYPGHATSIARSAASRGARLVIAVGGDGTIQEVVNGLFGGGCPINPDCELGIVDCGTGHGLAQSLGLPSRLEDQLDTIGLSEGLPMDLGVVTATQSDGSPAKRVFVSECQVGIGGAVVGRVGTFHKALGGAVAFGSATLATILRYKACPVSAAFREGTRVGGSCLGISFGNGSRCAGGMRLLPNARVDDGSLDVLVIRDMGIVERLVTFSRVYAGLHVDSRCCEVLRTTGVSMEAARPVPVAADGELLGATPCTIDVLPGAVRVRGPVCHTTRICHRLSSRSGVGGWGCKACDRGHRRRIQGDTVRRPTERNAADTVLSVDAADSR
jgi:diacylglycerol kinase (ATP)